MPGSDCGLLYSGMRLSGDKHGLCGADRGPHSARFLSNGVGDVPVREEPGEAAPDQNRPSQTDGSAVTARRIEALRESRHVSQLLLQRTQNRSGRSGTQAAVAAKSRICTREGFQARFLAEYAEVLSEAESLKPEAALSNLVAFLR